MAQDWKAILEADPTDWLLEPENPSVRYFTLRDVFEYSDEDARVVEARAAIRNNKKVLRICQRQKDRRCT